VQCDCRPTPNLFQYEKESVQEMSMETLIKYHVRTSIGRLSETGQKYTFYKISKQLSVFSLILF
jgi:hypothetical protein